MLFDLCSSVNGGEPWRSYGYENGLMILFELMVPG
ncbi:hypothetical protein SOVF_109160 [Spinacia oleracea]|nr:hypothetical protein SOVF_109160 [Spinacia oleracea]